MGNSIKDDNGSELEQLMMLVICLAYFYIYEVFAIQLLIIDSIGDFDIMAFEQLTFICIAEVLTEF